MTNSRDITVLRDLAKQYMDICHKPAQDERRELWRRQNSLERTRVLVLCNWLAAWHEAPEATPQCEDPFFRPYETWLRQRIFQDWIGDDNIAEPWVTVRASVVGPPHSPWGVPYGRIQPGVHGGAWKNDPPLRTEADLEKLTVPAHVIDEEATARNVARLQEAIGDIIEVAVDRAPLWSGWHADLSTDLGYLRGIDQFMLDMMDNREFLHRLLAFMRDGILKAQQEAEDAGDWSLANHNNQATPYCRELEAPRPNALGVKRSQLWVFMAAQEYTLVSPAMHEEFMFDYQRPIMEQFGLSAYGCCEDLTQKMPQLRKIRNLRRVGVTPVADVAKSAEAIGDEYVYSWRPNPTDMICCGFDPDHIRKVVRIAMEATRGCHVDITLKDVQTIENEPERLRRWVEIVRSVTDDY